MDTPSIWKSRKFWLGVADVLVSTAGYFVTKYVAPEIGNDILWLIATYQPVIIAIIASYTVQNVEAIRNG
jgi:hypothetical protein